MATYRKTLSSNNNYEVILNVTQSSQNIANNTSNISWNLQVKKAYGSGYWGADGTASTWAVSIDGTNVSSSSGSYDFRGGAPLTKTIASGTRTITHGGDGSKSIAVSGYWKDNANGLGSATASGTMALSTIPRATELTAFSFASHLKNGVANTINYTVSKKSTNFRNRIELKDGSTTVLWWDNSNSNGNSTITLTAANVNTLLSRMPASTTKTFTLKIATRSGVNGGWVGSAVSRNATATVHADVKPTLSGLNFGISGSGPDKTANKYVQGYTRVTANFTRHAGYGSSIKSSSMTVQTTGGANSQVINGNSGTTANVLSHSGTYRVVYTATDNRGRSTSSTSANFTVHAYSPPSISSLTLTRSTATPTEVTVVANGKFASIDGGNRATLNIQRRIGSTWSNVGTDNTSTNGTISRTALSTGNSITSSYEFKVKVTDSFGRVAEAVDTVSTQRVVLDIHKNEGVGIGKLRERGALDVNGTVYIDGWTKVENVLTARANTNHNRAVNHILYLERQNGTLLSTLSHGWTDTDAFEIHTYNSSGTWTGGHMFKQDGSIEFGGPISSSVENGGMTYASGFTTYAGNNWLGKTARVVQLSCRLKNANAFPGDKEVAVATLPVGFRPQTEFNAIMQGSAQATFLMTIRPNGIIYLDRYRVGQNFVTVAAGSWLNFNTTFLV